MEKIRVDGAWLYKIDTQEEWDQAIKENRPDYTDPITKMDVLERKEETTGRYEGPGFYYVCYSVHNPAWHGVDATKLDDDKRQELIEFLQ